MGNTKPEKKNTKPYILYFFRFPFGFISGGNSDIKKSFKTKSQALKFAKSYMRKH